MSVENDFDMSAPVAIGKTKAIYASKSTNTNGQVLVRSLDALTAGNAKRRNELVGKAAVATRTTCNVFKLLNGVGCKTHFIKGSGECDFIARRCEMIPIEWVARRIATGSFLKRHPGIKEGYTFDKPKIETFYKDDANNDPQWSDEQIIVAKFTYANGKRVIGRREIAAMKRWTSTIFRVLESAWRLHNCVLVDMKIEFGVANNGEIMLADVIDNDSWRVWPGGDRRLQLDKQMYRDLPEVTDAALLEIKKNYERVAEITDSFTDRQRSTGLTTTVVVVMGSVSDAAYADEIANRARVDFGVDRVLTRVCSAHKSVSELLDLIAEFENNPATVVVAVAGRSNGLGPVMSANTTLPVINAPPLSGEWADRDVWSSLRMPSGVGCSTVLSASEAALCAAKVLTSHSHWIFSRVLCMQTKNATSIMDAASLPENDLDAAPLKEAKN